MRFILLIGVLFLSGCNTLLGPLSTVITIGEASQAVKEAEDATTYPITPVKQIEPIPLPPQEPKIDLKKGIESIPTWLIMLAVISGSLYIINILRNYNKKGVSRDGDQVWNEETMEMEDVMHAVIVQTSIENPSITQDNEERAEAQSVVDATPHPVKDASQKSEEVNQ